jgi:hypothetical protein
LENRIHIKNRTSVLRSCAFSLAGWFLLAFAATSVVAQQSAYNPDWQKTAPTGDPTPLLDELRSNPEAIAAAKATATVRAASTNTAQPAATVNANFSGFQTAPYTSAHVSADTSRSYATVMGDFNQDGKMDVAVFSGNSKLVIMNGDGTGSFTQGSTLSGVGQVYKAIAADMNGDGYPDIVVLQTASNYLGTPAVLINKKDGTFAAPVSIKPGTTYHSLNGIYSGVQDFALYDVNGDGKLDIVMVSVGTVDTISYTNLIVETLFNNGDGTFTPSAAIETDSTLANKASMGWGNPVLVRQINGNPYLVFYETSALVGGGQYSTKIYSLPLASTGKVDMNSAIIADFGSLHSTAPTSYLQYVDVNKDGIDDLILNNGNGNIYIALGKSDGTFGTLSNVIDTSFSISTSNITVTDIDGDGNVDLLVPGSSKLMVFTGNGDGTFNTPKSVDIEGFGTISLSGLSIPQIGPMVYDWNGDGKLDVLYPDISQRLLVLFKGNGNGSFVGAPALISTQTDLSTSSIIAYNVLDLNGDNKQDIVASSPYGVMTGINDGTGKFQYKLAIGTPSIVSISSAHADFNLDGKQDFLVINEDGSYHYHPWLMYSNGDGSVTGSEVLLPYAQLSAPKIVAGDLNGDGYPDAVQSVYNYSTGLYGFYVLLNDGKGNLFANNFVSTGTTSSYTLYALELGDVNGDGYLDVIVSEGSSSATTVAVYLNPGTGIFTGVSPKTISGFTYPTGIIYARDLNADGKLDLLLGVQSGSYAGVYEAIGKGDGTFDAPTAISTAFVPSAISVEDFNSDGVYDIAAVNYESSMTDAMDKYLGVNIFRGIGDGTFAAPASFNVYPSSTLILPIDLTGSGAKSLLVYSSIGSTLLENKGGSTVTVAASSSSIGQGDTLTIKAHIASRVAGTATPTGTVTFYQDAALAGTGTLDATGTAYFATSSLTAGSHKFTAAYAGDTTYTANSVANTVSVAVSAVTPVFTMTNSNSDLTVARGSTASTALSFASNATFTGTIALSCSGLPTNASCSFSQSTVSLSPNQTATSTLTINTTGTTQAALHNSPLGWAGGAASLAALLMPVFFRRRRKILFMVLLAVVSMSGFLSGCGNKTDTVAKAGSYTVTVLATPSNSATAKTSTFLLTVH